jgi:hypothetical protein
MTNCPFGLRWSDASFARNLFARLEERREADVLEFVLDTAKRLNIAQLPVASILAALEDLAQSACEDRPVANPGGTSANTSDDPRPGLVEAFVRLTRNRSAANREALESAGLRWNGRSAGWSGRVTPEALERLRGIFRDRVEGPADSGTSAACSQGEANGPPVAVEAEAPAEEPRRGDGGPACSADSPSGTLQICVFSSLTVSFSSRSHAAADLAVSLAAAAPSGADVICPAQCPKQVNTCPDRLAGCRTKLLHTPRVAPIS